MQLCPGEQHTKQSYASGKAKGWHETNGLPDELRYVRFVTKQHGFVSGS